MQSAVNYLTSDMDLYTMRELSCESLLTAYTDDDLVLCQGTMLSISEEPGSFSSIQSDLDLAQHHH